MLTLSYLPRRGGIEVSASIGIIYDLSIFIVLNISQNCNEDKTFLVLYTGIYARLYHVCYHL